jgi:hypothetical protein
VNLRIARKIVKAWLSPWLGPPRHSIDQTRRAALRVFKRPIVVVADADNPWTMHSLERCRHALGGGRVLFLTKRLAVFETRHGLWEVRRRGGRIQIEDRTRVPRPLFEDEVTTSTYPDTIPV